MVKKYSIQFLIAAAFMLSSANLAFADHDHDDYDHHGEHHDNGRHAGWHKHKHGRDDDAYAGPVIVERDPVYVERREPVVVERRDPVVVEQAPLLSVNVR